MRPEPDTPGQAANPQQTFIEAARRLQIIEAALDSIAELGYARASLAEIAKRAGISKGVISYYFASKAELIEHVVVHVYTLGAMTMVPLVHSQPTAREMLRTYITSNIAFVASHRLHTAALMEIFSNFRDDNGELHYSLEDGELQVDALVALLEAGQSNGEFRRFDPRTMAVVIRAAIDQLVVRLVVFPDTDTQAYGNELADTFDRATASDPTL